MIKPQSKLTTHYYSIIVDLIYSLLHGLSIQYMYIICFVFSGITAVVQNGLSSLHARYEVSIYYIT